MSELTVTYLGNALINMVYCSWPAIVSTNQKIKNFSCVYSGSEEKCSISEIITEIFL